MQTSESKKNEGIYCCAYRCKSAPIARKGGLCHRHYKILTKERDKVYHRYNAWKYTAVKRGKSFTVTIEQFRRFCERTGYLTKGRRGLNATIDRRCNTHGYHIWNMQLLTNRQNASKGTKHSGDNFGCPF